MSDNPGIAGDRDRLRINTEQEHEVRYWSQKLGVTSAQLRAAVKDVGPMASAVEAHLRKGSGNSNWREKSVG